MSRNADNLSPILSSMIACAVGSCEGGPISSHQVVQNLSFTLGLDLQVLQLLKPLPPTVGVLKPVLPPPEPMCAPAARAVGPTSSRWGKLCANLANCCYRSCTITHFVFVQCFLFYFHTIYFVLFALHHCLPAVVTLLFCQFHFFYCIVVPHIVPTIV